mmetsp:Transcript_5245/g.13443  ORF Transcript_5245/g.13443 Transcript_5245/m.13443 type:complete len:375 (+) Transcript_5245:65-1189(+)
MADYVPKNVLITGGAGFIASQTVLHFAEKYPQYKLVVLDKLDYCASRKHLAHLEGKDNFKFIKGDITSGDLLNYLLKSEEIDTILHFAAQTHVDNSFGNSVVFTTNNVVGTHVLLEAAKAAMPRLKRFVHVSTDEVYGENPGEDHDAFHEHSKMEPTNPYAATKASAEMLIIGYWHSYKLPVIVTRGNNVYGPRQYPEKLIPKMVTLALRGMPLWIHGNGQQRRSYLHVRDVAAAFDAITHKGVLGERYNIGTNVDRTVLDVVQTIAKELNVPDERIKHVEDRIFNDQRYYMDSSKLQALGWKEEVDWHEGLKETIRWYKEHDGYWPNVSTALLPHPKVPVDTEQDSLVDAADQAKGQTGENGKGKSPKRAKHA